MATSPPAIKDITLVYFVIYLYRVSKVNASLPVDPHPQINTLLPLDQVSKTILFICSN